MARRAFSLLEVLIALTLGVVVLTTTVSLVVFAGRESDAARRRAHLSRSASFLNLNLIRDLRAAGLGMPTGPFHSPTGLGGDTGRFNAPILIGGIDELALVGDLPRPDADTTPFGSLSTMPGNNAGGSPQLAARFWWFTDANGVCNPRIDGLGCRTGQTSRLFPGVDGCARPNAGADVTCPWSQRRLLEDEYFVVIAGDGSWALARMPTTLEAAVQPSGDSRHVVFQSASNNAADWDPTLWANTNPQVDPPAALRGQGFVTSPDRVFYFLRDGAIRRIQCWGVPLPEHPGFPDKDALTIPDIATLAYAIPGRDAVTTCTTPEVVADRVTSLRFHYVDDRGLDLPVPLTADTKREVRSVRWEVGLEDARPGKITVNEALEGAVALRNLP